MSEKSEHIYSIIARKLSGEISERDLKLLDDWIAESTNNQIEYEDIQLLWEKTGTFQIPSKLDQSIALKQVHKRANIVGPKTQRLSLVYQVAAVLFLSIFLAGAYSYFFPRSFTNTEYFEKVTAAVGTRTHIDLPDGTRVLLNSGSTVRFSNQFTSKSQRRIELNGEAYFEVAKDPVHPFIVQAGQLTVRALGTEFNIDAYNPAETVEVVLVEGKVAVNQIHSPSSQAVLLSPSEKVQFSVKENIMQKAKADKLDKYIGWIDGKMVFVDDPIQEVILKLENWYNVDIRLEDQQLNRYRFTGTFIEESVDEILHTLSLTSPLHYEITPPQKDSAGRYSKRIIKLKMN